MSRHDGWATYLDDPASLELPVGERDALDRIRGVLADSVTWEEPPAGFTARVLELAAAEAADPTMADPTAADPTAADPTAADPTAADPAVSGPVVDSAAGAEPAADAPVVADPAASGRVVDSAAGAEPAVDAPVVSDPAVGPARRRAEERWFGRRARWITGATAAAAAAVLAAVLLWPDPLATYPVAGTAAQPGASAVVTLDPKPAGLAMSIDITGLPPSTADTYYAAWLRGPEGTVSVGTFHWKKAANPIDLWSGVEASRYPTFFITRQREGEPPTPSADVVLEGRVG